MEAGVTEPFPRLILPCASAPLPIMSISVSARRAPVKEKGSKVDNRGRFLSGHELSVPSHRFAHALLQGSVQSHLEE